MACWSIRFQSSWTAQMPACLITLEVICQLTKRYRPRWHMYYSRVCYAAAVMQYHLTQRIQANIYRYLR